MPSPGFHGREGVLTIGGVGSIAFQEKSITINNTMTDVTSDSSNGWQSFLAKPGVKAVELGFNGVVENLDLVLSAFNNTSQSYPCTLTYPEGSVISGDFVLGSVSNAMPTGEATTFEGSMQSDGEITFTAGI